MLTILFDGIAYGMVLFVLGCGLSVTMGLMNFVNLAHGAFAMLGGYVAVQAMQRLGIPFLATLPLAFLLRNYWALVIGIVTGKVAGTALSYLLHPYRPRLSLAARGEL